MNPHRTAINRGTPTTIKFNAILGSLRLALRVMKQTKSGAPHSDDRGNYKDYTLNYLECADVVHEESIFRRWGARLFIRYKRRRLRDYQELSESH